MIKKNEILPTLIQLEGQQSTNGVVNQIGLLNENTELGLKRKLRRIQKELMAAHKQYEEDAAEVNKIEDVEKRKYEMDKLNNEDYSLTSEKAMLSEIEKITSSFPYDFDLIEKIAE